MVENSHDVCGLSLAEDGWRRIEWAAQKMPVLQQVNSRFAHKQPLAGTRIGACLHVTTETANLIRVLKDGGAKIRLCASNPLSTQDDVAAAIVARLDVPVYAIKEEDNETYYRHIHKVITEVDPLRALEALMDGYGVMPMLEACEIGEILVTATGDINALDRPHFEKMKEGVILANSGHFNVEINWRPGRQVRERSRWTAPATTSNWLRS
jgi:S-adenosylhomocysteine hydrolase